VDRNDRQKDERLIKNQQQKWQGQNGATESQPGADKTTPDENQGNQQILVNREIRHGFPVVVKRAVVYPELV
jgi:hypothetical protein